MIFNILPSQNYLRQCFHYDPQSGVLTWQKRPQSHFATQRAYNTWNARYAGRPAGWIDFWGYHTICIDYRKYKTHRLIWKLMTDKEPPDQIDHRDQSRANNQFENLRTATNAQNHGNRGANRNNKLKAKGVYLPSGRKRFTARITYQGKGIYLGTFPTIEEAQAAYDKAAQRFFGEFACH